MYIYVYMRVHIYLQVNILVDTNSCIHIFELYIRHVHIYIYIVYLSMINRAIYV